MTEKPEALRLTEEGKPVTFLEAIREGIWEEMERDERVFILGEDIGVYGAARRAVDRARAGDGVTLIEAITYRRLGHAQHDNQSYQSREEIDRWAAANDPIDRYVGALLDNGWVSEEEMAAIDGQVEEELDAAVEEADASPLPDEAEVVEGVYAEGPVNRPWTHLDPPDPRRA
ncbi:MAG: hypothetical protein H0W11_00760 [Gemmatimonadetes bacterium]|nr:hypothetical protein [Gemmatimonadota bacterium]